MAYKEVESVKAEGVMAVKGEVLIDEPPEYWITINIAAGGTPLLGGGKSTFGHMWYELSSNTGPVKSYGFAPDEKHDGQPFAPGEPKFDDNKHYTSTAFSQTIKITRDQYRTLNNFGSNSANYGFSQSYNGLTNSCVDFVWFALQMVGLNGKEYEGALLPTWNKEKLRDMCNQYECTTLPPSVIQETVKAITNGTIGRENITSTNVGSITIEGYKISRDLPSGARPWTIISRIREVGGAWSSWSQVSSGGSDNKIKKVGDIKLQSAPEIPPLEQLLSSVVDFNRVIPNEKSPASNAQLDSLISTMAGMKESGSASLILHQQNLDMLQPTYAASLN